MTIFIIIVSFVRRLGTVLNVMRRHNVL